MTMTAAETKRLLYNSDSSDLGTAMVRTKRLLSNHSKPFYHTKLTRITNHASCGGSRFQLKI
jgi:hypothetical protein